MEFALKYLGGGKTRIDETNFIRNLGIIELGYSEYGNSLY